MSDKLKVLDLFSGIGGFSLGLERTGGFETVAFCEIEEFPRRVLAKHWPEVPCYHDVTKLTGAILAADGIADIDVITGGFPCQDISVAGKRAGIGEGTRSGLWSEIVRLIGELRPKYVLVENVANLLSGPSEKRGGWFGRILGDLAECGYDAEWENIPAASVGAPHRRERIWIVAYPQSKRCRKTRAVIPGPPIRSAGSSTAPKDVSHTAGQRSPQSWEPIFGVCGTAKEAWKADYSFDVLGRGIKPTVRRGDYGFRGRVDRLRACGNAVVPQIPEMIGRSILKSCEPHSSEARS